MLTANLTADVTYYFIVESYDSIASFDVMLVQGTYVEYVFNEATLIEPDEQKELTHDAQNEMTVLQFTPATSDYHTFFTPNDEDIVFTLYNQNGDELFQVSGQNTDDYLKLTLLLSQGQTYYLVIETAFDASTTFDVAVVTGMGPTGAPFTQTISMVSGDRQSITLNEDNEYKVIVSFTPTVSGYYTLTSYAPSENMVYDTYCDLFDSFGSMIGTHDDQYPNLNFALRYNLVAGQTYYYQVRNWYTQTVTFDIELMPS